MAYRESFESWNMVYRAKSVILNLAYRLATFRIEDMKLERKAYQTLVEWRAKYHGTRSLLIEGARRVGKTWLVREFGEREYRSCLIINFAQASSEVFRLFEENAFDLDYLYSALSVIYSVQLHERDHLKPACRQA